MALGDWPHEYKYHEYSPNPYNEEKKYIKKLTDRSIHFENIDNLFVFLNRYGRYSQYKQAADEVYKKLKHEMEKYENR